MKRCKTNVKNHGAMALFAACAAIAAAGVSLPASAECIAHWDFGSDALGEVDRMGNYNLVNSNGVTVVDGMAVFDNSTAPIKGYATRSSIQFDQSKAYTVECWVKPAANQSAANYTGMILELSNDWFGHACSLQLHVTEGAAVKASDNSSYIIRRPDASICDNEWHHLAVVVNPNGETMDERLKFYVDKRPQISNKTVFGSGTGIGLKPDVLYIGSRECASYPFSGQIADVRITEGILSVDDFLAPVYVQAYWKFDDGNPLADSSGNGNTLQGSQGVTFANGCASFNGSASNVRTANTLDLSAYKDVTVECFVRKHANANAVGMILEHSDSYLVAQEFYLALDDKGAGSVAGACRFSDTSRDFYSPANTVNTGWHHVALVKDSSKAGTDQCVRFYVDGIQQSTGTYKSTASGENLLNDYLYIGSRANSSVLLNADVDDVRISAQVLQPAQFLRTRTGSIEDVIAYWPFEKPENMMEDATGNGNVLTGTGVTVENGAAVFDGSQSGFATLSTLPLYPYESMTVEWYMRSSSSAVTVMLETSPDFNGRFGAFAVTLNDNNSPASLFAGYNLSGFNMLCSANACDGRWHHYALVYDGDNASELDDIKITGRALAPAEFMTKRSKPPTGMTLIFR